MNPEEYKWHISIVKDRFGYLNLTFEQAEKVYLHEKEKSTYSGKHFFSAWEEWDFDLSIFRKILKKDQLNDFKKEQIESIKNYEKFLIENDKPSDTEINFTKELIEFAENKFITDIFKNEKLLRFFSYLKTSNDSSKIEYFKKEYKKYLNDKKKELLTLHFRYNRSFKPNELELALLKHQLLYIIPEYTFFKRKMDKPTKAIADYLEDKSQYLIDTEEKTITELFLEFKKFSQKCFEKYYGKVSSADTYVIKAPDLSSNQKMINNTMTLVLLDEEKYGC